MSVIPRAASAAIRRGSRRSASSHSCHSSGVRFGWTPGSSSHDTTASRPKETTARYAAPPSRFQHTTIASRAAAAIPFSGSLSSIDAKRQREPTP